VVAVPVGSIDPPVDVAVTDVLAAPIVALGDTVSITATVQATGLAGRTVTVELRDSTGQPLEPRRVRLREGRQQVVFSWQAQRAGSAVLSVAAAAEPEEVVRENNIVERTIEVSERRSKVLVIDHAARWDLRFIDHAIRRDTGFEPTIVLTATDDPAAAEPAVPVDAQAWAAYDLVVLGDVPAALLDAGRQEAIVEAVTQHGVGLVLQPGADHLPRDYSAAPLAELFPVTIDFAAAAGAAIVEADAFDPLRMRVTARGAMHPAFALSGDAARNRAQWSEMPPFFRAAAATGPKPATTVLAEVEATAGRGAIPLIAESQAGSGRVTWIGTDETFRWRRNVGDALFWRFWGQALRSTARRIDRPGDVRWLVVSPDRCEPDAPVFVELNLVDAERKPVEQPSQIVTLTSPERDGDETIELRPAGRPGLYAGTFTPDGVGRHVVRHGQPPGGLAAECLVSVPTRERSQAGVDRDTLHALADLSGGTMIEVADFGAIAQHLRATAVESRTTLEDDVWDTWPVLLLLVGLTCLDVGIRRLSGSS